MKTLNTTIKWIDKKRKVKGLYFRFQKMYNKEIVVFDKYGLIKLINELKGGLK